MLKLHVGYCNSVLVFVGHPWIRSASGKTFCFILSSNSCKQKKYRHLAASVNGIYQVNKRDKQNQSMPVQLEPHPHLLNACILD